MFTNRRNHAAVVMGSHLAVFGGMVENSKVSNDLFVLDFKNFSWTKCNNLISSVNLPFLCSHGMAAIWPKELSTNNLN